MSLPVITFEPLHPGVEPPRRATTLSAGFDLRAYLVGRHVHLVREGRAGEAACGDAGALTLDPGAVALVPLGFRARLPDGYEAQVRIRSSVALRKGLVLPNAPGTIDADYPDEWLVMIRNAGQIPATIEHGERIAQAVLARYEVLEWRPGSVKRTTDRSGGFGSTG